jgi:hypothetical protein
MVGTKNVRDSGPVGLPMKVAIASHAARTQDVEREREKGALRSQTIREKAPQRFGPKVGPIWLATSITGRGPSPILLAFGSETGLQASLRELEQRYMDKNRIAYFQQKPRTGRNEIPQQEGSLYPGAEWGTSGTTEASTVLFRSGQPGKNLRLDDPRVRIR